MHLARGLTTTSTKKRKSKITKAMQAEFERGWRDRNQRLKEMHLPKETFEQYMEWLHGTGKKTKRQESVTPKASKAITGSNPEGERQTQAMGNSESTGTQVSKPSNWVTGACTSKPSPVYTGTRVLGIATMHKSNAVPIFSDEEAIEVSSMRR